MPQVSEWQLRPLESVYPLIFMDDVWGWDVVSNQLALMLEGRQAV